MATVYNIESTTPTSFKTVGRSRNVYSINLPVFLSIVIFVTLQVSEVL